MATYNEIKKKYEEDQGGMMEGMQQAGSSVRSMGGAIQSRDDGMFVDGAAEGIGALIGLGIRSSRMSSQNAKIEAINQALVAGNAQMEQGLYDEAINTASKQLIASEIAEAKVNGYHMRGTAYFLSGQYGKAVEDLTEAIRIVETSRGGLDRDALGDTLAMSYLGRGRAFEIQGQTGNALGDMTKAIQLAPDWDYAYYFRCLVLRAIGEYDQALSDANRAVAIQPGDAANYRERGRLYALTGSPSKAVDDLSRAVKLQLSVTNLRTRGQFFADQGEPAKALTDYSTALALDPNDVETLKLRAGLFEVLGAHTEAQGDLVRAAEATNRRSTFQSYLDKAKDIYEKGVTKTWTEADTRAKPNYPLAILLGVLTFIGTAIAVLFIAGLGGSGDATALCALAGLVLAPVVGVMVAVGRIRSPKEKARNAQRYFQEMALCEEQMPRFPEFYDVYLKARLEKTLPKLPETTQYLFE